MATTKEQRRIWYYRNREKAKQQSEVYRQKNFEKIKVDGAVWRAKNKDKLVGYNKNRRAKLYNLTLEQLQTLIDAPSCAICGYVFQISKEKQIDHSHTTGQVRGVLCVTCNTGIANFYDNVSLLGKAAEYLNAC